MKNACFAVAAFAAPIALAHPAYAAPGDPVAVSQNLTIDPIIEGRLRYEGVDQPATDADALTMRVRAGAEAKTGSLSLLVEGEGTLAIESNYNAFPFAIADTQRRPQYSVVPDPMNVELNRLQMQYKAKGASVTIGRQRINLDDQRWVGSVGWRQSEQTFDAIRGEWKLGPVSLDGTYSISQRTVFGIDAGPRQAYDGSFFFAGAGMTAGPVTLKGFAYLLDYDDPLFRANSSQTFGVRATGTIPLAGKAKLALAASYARQSDYKGSTADFGVDYLSGEANLTFGQLTLTGGYESLGADRLAGGGYKALQTPMATLHKFNGWADIFLTTPQAATYGGLQDAYVGAIYKFSQIKALPGLNAAVSWHQFDSERGNVEYGTELDASLGFKIGRVGLLAKYSDYNAGGFGVDTKKFWLQAEFAY